MPLTLLTGAGGYIGTRLLETLARRGDDVVGLSRQDMVGTPVLKGDFTCEQDLHVLDGFHVDRLCHLAAVTGGCSEEDGFRVNVLGTRRLMRYLVDRGCRKFVLASSIAVVGLAASDFVPEAVPIPDEHPCLARDAYGLSKYLMEETSRYFSRAQPDLEITVLRLCSIFPGRGPTPKVATAERPPTYALASITKMTLKDSVAAFSRALQTDLGPGFRIFNAGPQRAWTEVPVATLLDRWLDGQVSASHYQSELQAFDSVFAVNAIAEELGFVASV